jgi:hypothetical protein
VVRGPYLSGKSRHGAPKRKTQKMPLSRYELSDYEWTAIKPMLPNKPRGA